MRSRLYYKLYFVGSLVLVAFTTGLFSGMRMQKSIIVDQLEPASADGGAGTKKWVDPSGKTRPPKGKKPGSIAVPTYKKQIEEKAKYYLILANRYKKAKDAQINGMTSF